MKLRNWLELCVCVCVFDGRVILYIDNVTYTVNGQVSFPLGV